jgi:hypothetical protein
VCARSRKTTVLAAVAGAIRIQMPQVTLRVKITRRLSVKCWFLGHDDWIRRGPDRLYLECVECGRETHGWTTDRTHRADRAAGGAIEAAPTRKRRDHSAPASVQSPIRQSLTCAPIADDRDMTTAA